MRQSSWKRWGFTGIIIAMLGALLAGCGSDDQSSGVLKLRIADITSNPVFRVAESKGIFKKHGIDAEIITFATPAEGINSLFIKQVDIAYGADFPILNAVSKGDYSVISSTGMASDANAKEWKLFVRKDISKAADLKGKKLSFSRGTFIPYLWDVYLAENGVALRDVELIGQGGFDESYVALKKGEVDGVWIYGAVLNDKFAALEEAHELTDMSQTPVRLGTGLIAPNELIAKNEDQLVAFLKALDEASTYAQEHPDETADLLYKEVKQPREATLKDLPNNPWSIGFTQKAYDGLASQKKYMIDNKLIEKDFELNEKLHLELVRKAFPDRVIELK